VGKTTTCQGLGQGIRYLNWDRPEDRKLILSGTDKLEEILKLTTLKAQKPILVLDELLRFTRWKNMIKGIFDTVGEKVSIVLTGSARMNVYKKGGDSLMGRYFSYRMHPLSIREILNPQMSSSETSLPIICPSDLLHQLLEFGGFPEPFIKSDRRFFNRWRRLRNEQLFKEDIRDLSRASEMILIEHLSEILRHQSGQLFNYSRISIDLGISVDTVKRWLSLLDALFCFRVKPWFNNIPKSLRKQPKIYLYDWSQIPDPGLRFENLVASHLLKAVHFWTDSGLGEYDLYYLRDKQKREVDFLVIRNNMPFFLVEAKSSSSKTINPALEYFQKRTGATHAFQVVMDMDDVNRDCFMIQEPVRVPATTFLSQLI